MRTVALVAGLMLAGCMKIEERSLITQFDIYPELRPLQGPYTVHNPARVEECEPGADAGRALRKAVGVYDSLVRVSVARKDYYRAVVDGEGAVRDVYLLRACWIVEGIGVFEGRNVDASKEWRRRMSAK